MKTAIIVGASSGIGRELAKILSAKRFHLGLADRRIYLLVDLGKKLPNKYTTQLSKRKYTPTLPKGGKLSADC